MSSRQKGRWCLITSKNLALISPKCTEWTLSTGRCECFNLQSLYGCYKEGPQGPSPDTIPPTTTTSPPPHPHRVSTFYLPDIHSPLYLHTGSNQIWWWWTSRNEATWYMRTYQWVVYTSLLYTNCILHFITLGLVMLILRCMKPSSCFVVWRTETVNSPYLFTPLVLSAGQYW